jgi:hypothetical protein
MGPGRGPAQDVELPIAAGRGDLTPGRITHDSTGGTVVTIADKTMPETGANDGLGQAGDHGAVGGLVERVRATLRILAMAATAEGIQPRQAAQAGGPSQPGAGLGVAAAARTTFRREGEYWTVGFEGVVVYLRDAKGLRHLARLLAQPGQEVPAVALEAAEGHRAPTVLGSSPGRATEPGLVVRGDLGDAGVWLDATAKAAYRARLVEVRAELAEAEGDHDPVRAAKARVEMEFLVAELARAVGLGGRDRRAASHAERARLNATRAIRAAMANVARVHPALGRHLAATIRTGRYCAYVPDPRLPIRWES